MSVDGFYLIIIDRDASVFNIEGPMKDDEKWNEKVYALQQKGRNVNCSAANSAYTFEQLKSETSMRTGFTYSDDSILNF